MKRTAILLLGIAAVAAMTMPAFAAQQPPFPLTDKLKNLEGTWVRDPSRGTGGICGVPPTEVIAVSVSATEVTFQTGTSGGVGAHGPVKLDGTATVFDGRTMTASLDAGWLAVTMRRTRSRGANVMREVYIPLRGELTVWRTLNVELPDGTQGKIDCGNRQAIVYTRK